MLPTPTSPPPTKTTSADPLVARGFGQGSPGHLTLPNLLFPNLIAEHHTTAPSPCQLALAFQCHSHLRTRHGTLVP